MNRRLRDVVATGDAERYVGLNKKFHELICRGARNDVLVDVSRNIRLRSTPYRRAQFNNLSRLAASHAEHMEIVDAIQRGDAQGAAACLYRHIMAVLEMSVNHLHEQMERQRLDAAEFHYSQAAD